MAEDTRGPVGRAMALVARACPRRANDHVILEVNDDEAQRLGRQPGLLHVDRGRQPAAGDLVWAEIVRRGSTQRLVRRFARDAGWVTLSVPDDSAPAIMRRQSELLVLGVVDDAGCAATADPAPDSPPTDVVMTGGCTGTVR